MKSSQILQCGFVICPCDLHGYTVGVLYSKQSYTSVVSRLGNVGNLCPRSRCRNPHDQAWSCGRVGFPRYCCAVDTITVNNVEQRESCDTCPKGQLMTGSPPPPPLSFFGFGFILQKMTYLLGNNENFYRISYIVYLFIVKSYLYQCMYSVLYFRKCQWKTKLLFDLLKTNTESHKLA